MTDRLFVYFIHSRRVCQTSHIKCFLTVMYVVLITIVRKALANPPLLNRFVFSCGGKSGGKGAPFSRTIT